MKKLYQVIQNLGLVTEFTITGTPQQLEMGSTVRIPPSRLMAIYVLTVGKYQLAIVTASTANLTLPLAAPEIHKNPSKLPIDGVKPLLILPCPVSFITVQCLNEVNTAHIIP